MPLNVNPLEPGICFVEFFAERFFGGETRQLKLQVCILFYYQDMSILISMVFLTVQIYF